MTREVIGLAQIPYGQFYGGGIDLGVFHELEFARARALSCGARGSP